MATVTAILDALPHVLIELGEKGLTTERVAERAGVSIGTLYQYFANREALLVGWLARERTVVDQVLTDVLTAAAGERATIEAAVAQAVALLVQRLGGDTSARRALLRMAWAADSHQAMQPELTRAAQRNAALLSHQADGVVQPDALSMWLCIRAVMGVVRAASLEASPWLGTPAFNQRLTVMVLALLQVGAAPAQN